MTADMSEPVRLVAAKEHTLAGRHRPIRAHVIVTHDLDIRLRAVLGMFSVASRCDKALLEEITRQMLLDIIVDAETLEGELSNIKRQAERQLKNLPTKLNGGAP